MVVSSHVDMGAARELRLSIWMWSSFPPAFCIQCVFHNCSSSSLCQSVIRNFFFFFYIQIYTKDSLRSTDTSGGTVGQHFAFLSRVGSGRQCFPDFDKDRDLTGTHFGGTCDLEEVFSQPPTTLILPQLSLLCRHFVSYHEC